MGRSVATHPLAVETVFLDCTDLQEEYEWDDLIEDIASALTKAFPSMEYVKRRWRGNEVRVILENMRGEVSVSEYCGLVAVCLAPRDECHELDRGWCASAAKRFVKEVQALDPKHVLIPVGRASNGEAFFRPLERPEGCFTSKEGTLW